MFITFNLRSLDREKDGRLSKGSAMGIFGIDSGKIRDMQEKDLRRSFENTCKVFCKISYLTKSDLINYISYYSNL